MIRLCECDTNLRGHLRLLLHALTHPHGNVPPLWELAHGGESVLELMEKKDTGNRSPLNKCN